MMKFNQSVKVFNSNSWKLMKVFDNFIISVPIAPSTPKLLTIGVDFIEVSTTVSNADALCESTKVLIYCQCSDFTTTTFYLKPNFAQSYEVSSKFTEFSPSLKCLFVAEVESDLGRAQSNSIAFETLPMK